MSVTFEVYPRSREIPTFGALIESSTKELHRFLASIGIRARPHIHVKLQACKDNAQLPFSLDDHTRWGKDTYAWFMVGDAPGGTDAYFDNDADAIREFWERELGDSHCKKLGSAIRDCVSVGHRWWFRRSIGQPAVINLAYGLLAGSLASMTNGIVHTTDSAWDWQRMPAFPAEFLSLYFRPKFATEENFRSWSERCLSLIAAELGEPEHL